jgi:hypothetical protein
LPRCKKGAGKQALTATDGVGVRFERDRQEPISFKDKNSQFPGFVVKKGIPVGGGWSDDVVTFFVSFDSEVFPHGAERIDKTSRSEKSAGKK